MPAPAPLPVDAVLPELLAALRSRRVAVLVAPPGAGKTTRVPPALLDQPWLSGRIVMLEPRRLAARAAASFMARARGESVGQTVGYRVRGDSRVGPATRIEVVTEGVLTRWLADDPTLDGVGAVLFDEFHERHLQGDLGLALALHARRLVRDDLAIVVMSATLQVEPVSRLLGDAPVVRAEGRVHPVETRWMARRPEVALPAHAARAVREALALADGDALVFLPGVAEITRCASALQAELPAGVELHPLHGTLPLEAQDRAVAPAPPGRRKVVLATAIAESSLTIEGVRIVVDAGLARVPRFDPRTGMSGLATVRVSRDSADQRRGRAGRTAPGLCVRLWDQGDEAQLRATGTPELLEADLTSLALELAVAGIGHPRELPWLEAPPEAALAQGRALLRRLGALDALGRVTAHGREMARLGTHPRLAHLLLRGRALGRGALACEVAALLDERDILPRDTDDADLALRVLCLHDAGEARQRGADRGRVQRVRDAADRWWRELRREGDDRREGARGADALAQVGTLAAMAYPDRVARRRGGGAPRFVLANGRGAVFAAPQPLANTEWLVVLDADGEQADVRIHRAAALTRALLEEACAEAITEERVVEWDDDARAVRAVRRRRLDALVLEEGGWPDADPPLVRQTVLEAVRRAGIAGLPWVDEAQRLRARIAFAHLQAPAQWPDTSDAALLSALDTWLVPALHDARRWRDVESVDLTQALGEWLGWARRAELDRLAPTHLTVPSGSRIPVDYTDPQAPRLSVRLQELFGSDRTPAVWDGRVPITLHLLSPAHRPMQVTRDLAGFWRGAYHEVRKDLRGRYPRHHWPEDPMAAPPTARAKRRGE